VKLLEGGHIMSRSHRKPAFSIACGGNHSKEGKQVTSRELRRKVRQLLHIEGEDFNFIHHQDRNRGKAGSKDMDWGAVYFGDGRTNPYQGEIWADEDEDKLWFETTKRK